MTSDGFASEWTSNGFTVPQGGGVSAPGSTSVRPRTSAGGANFLVDVVFEPHPGYLTPTATPTSQPPTPTHADGNAHATPTATPTVTPTATHHDRPPTPTPTTTPTPTPTPTPRREVTGRQRTTPASLAGTTLTTYSGPLTITTANTVIRNSVVNGTLQIQAPGVQIINSRVNGGVDLRSPKTTTPRSRSRTPRCTSVTTSTPA